MPDLPHLRWHRLRCALTQEALAAASGVSRPTIARIERGESVYPSTIGKLAQALGISPSDLMDLRKLDQEPRRPTLKQAPARKAPASHKDSAA